MQIAYLFDTHDIYRDSGILKKVREQASCWREMGHRVEVFIICGFIDQGRTAVIDCTPVNLLRIKQEGNAALNYLNKIGSRSRLSGLLKKFNPDILYVRQNIWYPGLSNLYAQYNTVMEFNTLDLEEIRHDHPIRQMLYKYGRSKLLSNISGTISVSHEIAAQYPEMKGTVVSNGISLKPVKHKTGVSGRVNVIFTGTPKLPWHGVDKFVQLAQLMPEYRFHLVGPKAKKAPPNLIQYGLLDSNELEELYTKMDIGVGTLALHRNGMNEASPLKVREYLQHRLPIIIAYKDTDLNTPHESVLELPNTPDNIESNSAEIKRFIELWKGKRLESDEIRKRINRKEKERQRIAYFESVLVSKRK